LQTAGQQPYPDLRKHRQPLPALLFKDYSSAEPSGWYFITIQPLQADTTYGQ
jgi:hypothetical protein